MNILVSFARMVVLFIPTVIGLFIALCAWVATFATVAFGIVRGRSPAHIAWRMRRLVRRLRP